jgi:hypothetical protein
MNVRAALKGQYLAALAMLRQAINECPEALWRGDGRPNDFWRVAYHALFFTHLYLHRRVEDFRPWAKHRDEAECLGPPHHSPHRPPTACEPFTRTEMTEYLQLCADLVAEAVETMDLDAVECGFPWYQIPKLDHQINNIRHLQHHTALLADRLRRTQGTDVHWVGFRCAAQPETAEPA